MPMVIEVAPYPESIVVMTFPDEQASLPHLATFKSLFA